MDKKRRRDDELTNGAGVDHHEHQVPSATASNSDAEVVIVEPFFGGSHKQLVDLLVKELLEPSNVPHAVCTLPPRKWHWRLMASSMYFASTIPRSNALRVLFLTSMVNLSELLGLRPDLNVSTVKKVYYFHENQLTYPFQVPLVAGESMATSDTQARRKVAAEDFQIGWAQIVSCLAADELVFNSDFNRTSFLSKVDAFINKIPEPEMRQRGLSSQVRSKSRVLFFPLTVPVQVDPPVVKPADILTILWNHRWEYDKNPDEFFQTLFELDSVGVRFQLIVLGEAFGSSPPIFASAKAKLQESKNVTIVHWGYAESKSQYFELLRRADVVVSTSLHEFYGVAVLEAVLCGCYPLVPNRLVYPEFFKGPAVFNTQRQLFKKLKGFCARPVSARGFLDARATEFDRFTWMHLKDQYEGLLQCSNNTILSQPHQH